jgi:hypothetical protein
MEPNVYNTFPRSFELKSKGRRLMSENERSHRHHGERDPNGDQHGQRPYWTRAHHDWKFWVALSLMLAAMFRDLTGNGYTELVHNCGSQQGALRAGSIERKPSI